MPTRLNAPATTTTVVDDPPYVTSLSWPGNEPDSLATTSERAVGIALSSSQARRSPRRVSPPGAGASCRGRSSASAAACSAGNNITSAPTSRAASALATRPPTLLTDPSLRMPPVPAMVRRAARSRPEASTYVTSATIRPCDRPTARLRNQRPGADSAQRPPTATSSSSTGRSRTSTNRYGSLRLRRTSVPHHRLRRTCCCARPACRARSATPPGS